MCSILRHHVAKQENDVWANKKVPLRHVAEHPGGDIWRNANVPCRYGGRRHVSEPGGDTWPNGKHDVWTSRKMTHVRTWMRHVFKHESDTWASWNTTRGRTWWLLNFGTWLFHSSPCICLPAKRAASMAPNGIKGVPCHLPARTETHGSGRLVTFL